MAQIFKSPSTILPRLLHHRNLIIAIVATCGIVVHLVLWAVDSANRNFPLYVTLMIGGSVLILDLLLKAFRGLFGSDLLAGIAIVTAILLEEYLAGSFVVLMLSGGETLELYAKRRASSVLDALARRLPRVAHRVHGGTLKDIPIEEISPDDQLVVLPHEICPVDGVVVEGHGMMDEAYLTGEPFQISKAPGSPVLSGANNGESALTIRALKRADDSRYAKIMQVMREIETRRPRIRRLGDALGALYTPLALLVAGGAWWVSGEPLRMLAVLVIATPCPLLIAIPVAIIGAISLAAKRGIIIKDPAVLERMSECTTVIFDKTGTLTYGEPELAEVHCAPGFQEEEVLSLTAGLEQYSKHPLATAIVAAAKKRHLLIPIASEMSEKPGEGLRGTVRGHRLLVSSLPKLLAQRFLDAEPLTPHGSGLECAILIDGRFAGLFRFRDTPRLDSRNFVAHLSTQHGVTRVLLVSGDRESEVRYLAEKVGISEFYFGKSPEEKVAIVQAENTRAFTMFVGDGINDAPALAVASVGIAFGQNSDITNEAADAVVMDASLRRVDELLHISKRMRAIALQSAVGGMALSVVGMFIAAVGYLPPVGGAIVQEVIDVFAIMNALRVSFPQEHLTDYPHH